MYYDYSCKLTFVYFRLSSYVPKHRTLSLDALKVKYSSANKEIKLYSDASTNGVKRNTAVVNQNVRYCTRFEPMSVMCAVFPF